VNPQRCATVAAASGSAHVTSSLDLDDFKQPVLRGEVHCSDEDACSLTVGIDVYDDSDPDAPPAHIVTLGTVQTGEWEEIDVDLGSFYVPGEFSLVFYALTPGAADIADQSDRAFWVDLRIEDDG
jgi:hypothetical protein